MVTYNILPQSNTKLQQNSGIYYPPPGLRQALIGASTREILLAVLAEFTRRHLDTSIIKLAFYALFADPPREDRPVMLSSQERGSR